MYIIHTYKKNNERKINQNSLNIVVIKVTIVMFGIHIGF